MLMLRPLVIGSARGTVCLPWVRHIQNVVMKQLSLVALKEIWGTRLALSEGFLPIEGFPPAVLFLRGIHPKISQLLSH